MIGVGGGGDQGDGVREVKGTELYKASCAVVKTLCFTPPQRVVSEGVHDLT